MCMSYFSYSPLFLLISAGLVLRLVPEIQAGYHVLARFIFVGIQNLDGG